jgi:hypothetical protein
LGISLADLEEEIRRDKLWASFSRTKNLADGKGLQEEQNE